MTNDKFGECGDIRALLDEYIDGELQGERAEVVERHIAACAACRSELEELSSLKQLVGESALSSPGISARVMERINSGKVKMKKQRRVFVPIGTLAALAAVLVIVAINKNVFDIFGNKTSMDNSAARQDPTQSLNYGICADDADTATEEMLEMKRIPEDAQFVPPANNDVLEQGDMQGLMANTEATEYTGQGVTVTEDSYGDGFDIELNMNSMAQKIKEESKFSIVTNRTYLVHLPEDYNISQLFEGLTVEEDSGIYVLNIIDETSLKSKLDSIPDALYNSYAEVTDSDKIAVIILEG